MPVARVFVGVTGGIAAYKACELVRLLVRAGHDVTPTTMRATGILWLLFVRRRKSAGQISAARTPAFGGAHP